MALNSNSTVTRSRDDQISSLANNEALILAKKSNDQLYTKFLKLRKAYLILKAKLINKYSMKGTKAARAALLKVNQG